MKVFDTWSIRNLTKFRYEELNSGIGPFVVTRLYCNSFRHRYIFQWSKCDNIHHIVYCILKTQSMILDKHNPNCKVRIFQVSYMQFIFIRAQYYYTIKTWLKRPYKGTKERTKITRTKRRILYRRMDRSLLLGVHK